MKLVVMKFMTTNKYPNSMGFLFFIFVSDDRSIEKTNIAKTRLKNTIKMSIAFFTFYGIQFVCGSELHLKKNNVC